MGTLLGTVDCGADMHCVPHRSNLTVVTTEKPNIKVRAANLEAAD